MTALSWFFGGKKKEEKPVTVEAVEVGNDEDYAIIQAYPNQPGLYPQMPQSLYPTSQFYTPLPYSVLPQRQDQQPAGSVAVRANPQNQLEGVPFVLSPKLEQGSSQSQIPGLDDLRRAVFQIAADINDPMFQYEFNLEHSVMQEASLYNRDSA
uniref:UMA domain-containing protein n=1 Tax=Homalodisca liturata TaxID=320908 RepID=A0A1B6JX64_9HEMI